MDTDKMHVLVSFCLNDTYSIEYIPNDKLQDAISYNDAFRPGKFHFVDGKYVCGGMLKQPYQQEFIDKCATRLKTMNIPDRPET